MLLGASSLILIAPLVLLDGLPILGAAVIFIAMPITSSFITYAVKTLDQDSVASLRRVFGLTMASNLIWSVPLYIGSLLSWLRHDQQFSLNEFTLGAFVAWSFELLVINGAFIPSTARSIAIAAVQPLVTLLVAASFIIKPNASAIYSVVLGLAALAIMIGFLLKFKTFKTQGAGINTLSTFQSFLKSWVSQKPAKLESYFTMYSRDEPVTTRVVLASGTDQVAMVLPGVHPGPFYPVGSYNVSELIFHELRKVGVTPIVLHGVGGHERNLPTNELAKQYAATIASAVRSPTGAQRTEKMKGPSRFQSGPTTVTTLEFGDHVVAFLSNAPYNTDDLEPSIIDGAVSAAKDLGVELMLVDAHNSIGGQNCQQPDLDWRKILSDTTGKPEHEFEVGMAHSSEIQFTHGSDVSDGGIAALVFRNREGTYALITSDSNNAALGLRQRVMEEFRKENVELIELCTSDTHSSAARYLSSRGYSALGEESDQKTLAATMKKLEKLAEGRLSQGRVATFTSQVTLPLIGDRSLNDFASLTKDALGFAKSYAAAALASLVIIGALALL